MSLDFLPFIGGDEQPEPLYQNLPGLLNSIQEGNAQLEQFRGVEGISDPALNALQQFRAKTGARGAQPISVESSIGPLVAASQNRAVTPEPERSPFSFISNVGSNLRTLGSAIPKLPGALISEVQRLPTLPTAIAEAQAQAGGNPIELIGNLATAPGINLLPGAFVAEQFGTEGGGFAELARNPVFTALDVLPFASAGARALPVNRAIRATNEATFADELARVTTGDDLLQSEGRLFARRAREKPFRNLFLRRLDESGQVVPTRAGTVTNNLAEVLNRSDFVQDVKAVFAGPSRDVSQMVAMLDEDLRRRIDPSNTGQYDDAISVAAQEGAGMGERYGVDLRRQAKIFELAQRGEPGWNKQLAGNELAMIEEYTRRRDEITNAVVADEQGALMSIDGETYTGPQGRAIIRARRIGERAERLGDTRARLEQGSGDLDQAVSNLDEIRNLDTTKKDMLFMAEGELRILQAAGWDVSEQLRALRRPEGRPGGSGITDVRRATKVFEPGTAGRIAEELTQRARTDFVVRDYVRSVQRGRWKQAREALNQLAQRQKFTVVDPELVPQLRAELSAYVKRDEFLAKTTAFKDPSKIIEKAARTEARIIPARFVPAVEPRVQQAAVDRINELVERGDLVADSDAQLMQWVENAENSIFHALAADRGWPTIKAEIAASWKALKAEGYDPLYIFHVDPRRAGSVARPGIVPRKGTLRQIKERSLDFAPAVPNFDVALRGQAVDALQIRGNARLITEIQETMGRSVDDLTQQYLPAATVRSQATGQPVRQVLDDMIRREWGSLPDEMFQAARVSSELKDGNVLVPKSVAITLNRMVEPPLARTQSVLDPLAAPFRTSVLALSPRWHLNNVVGNAMVTVMRNPRALLYLNRARKMLDDAPDQIPDRQLGLGLGSGSVPSDFAPDALAREFSKANNTAKLRGAFQFKAGQQARTWLDQASFIVDQGGKLVRKSYDWNAMVDDMFRTANYLDGTDKALRAGMDDVAARQAGIESARATMQQWDRMTPIERSLIRTIFPFYGWISHIMRYVLTYPFDHPVRTSIIASFARNELEDFGTGLPQRFFELLTLGDQDENGNVTTISLGGANPFGDMHNYFSLQGFAGQTHPLIATTLETLGVDTRTGTAQLYPDLYYDPELGRMAVRPAGATDFFGNLITNTVPQAELLASMAGLSGTWKEVARTNPDAARRMLTSQLGLPVLFRDVNVSEEIIRAEITREEAARSALNEAIRSGSDTEASRFPSLRPSLSKLRELQSAGQLDAFQLTDEQKAELSVPEQNSLLALLQQVPLQGQQPFG